MNIPLNLAQELLQKFGIPKQIPLTKSVSLMDLAILAAEVLSEPETRKTQILRDSITKLQDATVVIEKHLVESNQATQDSVKKLSWAFHLKVLEQLVEINTGVASNERDRINNVRTSSYDVTSILYKALYSLGRKQVVKEVLKGHELLMPQQSYSLEDLATDIAEVAAKMRGSELVNATTEANKLISAEQSKALWDLVWEEMNK